MADTQYSVLSGIFKRLADIGSGHHAEVVAVVNPDGSPISGGGGGGGGSVTAPGVSGAQAQAVQGVTGGVPMPVVPNVTRGGGNVDAGTQRVTLAQDGPGVTALNNLDADLGAQADAAATSDTGTFSLIALVKRGLTNWTTLLARIPALVSGRVPVDGSGVTQPVSGTVAVSNFPANPATSALQTTGNTSLSSIDTKLPAQAGGRVPVQTDERPSASAAAITPSDTTALSGTTRGIYVGVSGTVVALIGGTAVTFVGVPAGTILPVQATRVNATGTNAASLVALF